MYDTVISWASKAMIFEIAPWGNSSDFFDLYPVIGSESAALRL